MNDPGLRASDAASRGIWRDLLHIMVLGPEPGYLMIVPGVVPNAYELAQASRNTLSQTKRAIRVLEANGVFSRDARGVAYCRRMLRELGISAARQAAGRLGGNPALRRDDRQAELEQYIAESYAGVAKSGPNYPVDIPVDNPVDDRGTTVDITAGEVGPQSNESPTRVQRTLVGLSYTTGVSTDNSDLPGNLLNQKVPTCTDRKIVSKPVQSNPLDSSPTGVPRKSDSILETGLARQEKQGGLGTGLAAEGAVMQPVASGSESAGQAMRFPEQGRAAEMAIEDAALAAYNAMAALGFPSVCKGLTAARRERLRARLQELGGLEAWHRAMHAIEQSPEWQGRVPARGDGVPARRPSIDDALSAGRLKRLLDGGRVDVPPAVEVTSSAAAVLPVADPGGSPAIEAQRAAAAERPRPAYATDAALREMRAKRLASMGLRPIGAAG